MKRKVFVTSGIMSGVLILALIAFSITTWLVSVREAQAQVKTVSVNKIAASLVSSNDSGAGKYTITLQCSLDLDATPEYQFSITQDYLIGDSVSALYGDFLADMQAEIDKYTAEQSIYDHAQLDTIVTNLEAGLSW